MASGTKSKGKPKSKGASKSGRSRAPVSRPKRPKPWGMIAAVLAVVLLAGGVFTYAFMQINEKEKWVASEDNKDPSDNIEGVEKVTYEGSDHVTPDQRVAYDQSPPFGGPHDQAWANCSGTVYETAVRTENMVHSLEHGAVWIAYNPDELDESGVTALTERVEGQPYLMLSPYPGIDSPITLQSWGHQLKVDDAGDERIDQFIQALRANEYTTPEPGATCDTDPSVFDVTNPPPFDPSAPGPDAMPVNGN
jgi:Protein of unknown function (DUF3105)